MDREQITIVSLWVHVPFIITWIGLVMLDAFALFAPGVADDQRRHMLQWSRRFVLLAIPVIMVTGIWQTMENPFLRVDSFSRLELLRQRTLYGDLLFWKHGFVLLTFGLTVLVRFVLAPRWGLVLATEAGRIESMTGMERLLKLASLLNLGACAGAVLLATRMVLELH